MTRKMSGNHETLPRITTDTDFNGPKSRRPRNITLSISSI